MLIPSTQQVVSPSSVVAPDAMEVGRVKRGWNLQTDLWHDGEFGNWSLVHEEVLQQLGDHDLVGPAYQQGADPIDPQCWWPCVAYGCVDASIPVPQKAQGSVEQWGWRQLTSSLVLKELGLQASSYEALVRQALAGDRVWPDICPGSGQLLCRSTLPRSPPPRDWIWRIYRLWIAMASQGGSWIVDDRSVWSLEWWVYFGIQAVCMPDLDHTSSKRGVEYSACFQHSLARWCGRSACVLVSKLMCRSWFCESAFTGVGDIQIWYNLWVLRWLLVWFLCLMHGCMIILPSMTYFGLVKRERIYFGVFVIATIWLRLCMIFTWALITLFGCWWMFRDDCTGNVLDAERFLLHVLCQTLHENVSWRICTMFCAVFSQRCSYACFWQEGEMALRTSKRALGRLNPSPSWAQRRGASASLGVLL